MNNYNINLSIDVTKKYICGESIFTYEVINNRKSIEFLIIDDFDVKVESEDAKAISVMKIDSWMIRKNMKQIHIDLREESLQKDNLDIRFSYEGTINAENMAEGNLFTNNLVELNIYTPIFPILESFDTSYFQVNIKFESDDGKFIVIGNNILKKENSYQIKCKDIDFVLFIANKENFYNMKENTIETNYFDKASKTMAENTLKFSKTILYKYMRWFGTIENSNMRIIISSRKNGGAYCRNGLIVMSNEELSDSKLFRYIAHELAHLWWNKANPMRGYEDWLNEAFAEYSSLMALREEYGENQFNNLVELYSRKVQGLPSIKSTLRRDENAFGVFYMKGALVLKQLEEKICNQVFIKLLKEIHLKKIDTTEKLLKELEAMLGNDVSTYLDNLLNK